MVGDWYIDYRMSAVTCCPLNAWQFEMNSVGNAMSKKEANMQQLVDASEYKLRQAC